MRSEPDGYRSGRANGNQPMPLKVKRQSRYVAGDEHTVASLEISIGNARCSGEALNAQIEWARTRFASFEFSVADTLNAYNYASIGHPIHGVLRLEHARRLARDEGEHWVRQNLGFIEARLKDRPFRIRRWDDWMSLAEVRGCLSTVNELFRAQPLIAGLMVRERAEFLTRRRLDLNALSDTAQELLLRYVLEEVAVFYFQNRCGPHVHLYPGDLAVLRRIRNLPDCPAELRHSQYVLFELGDSNQGTSR